MSDALLLRPSEAAELLGVSRSKVYELAQAGDLAGALRLGGSVRIHRPTLEAWLAEQAAGVGIRRAPATSQASVQSSIDMHRRPATAEHLSRPP